MATKNKQHLVARLESGRLAHSLRKLLKKEVTPVPPLTPKEHRKLLRMLRAVDRKFTPGSGLKKTAPTTA